MSRLRVTITAAVTAALIGVAAPLLASAEGDGGSTPPPPPPTATTQSHGWVG